MLHVNASCQKAVGFDRPRVWWCVTGDLSFLPIHAAGITGDDNSIDFVADYFISSYVPTLSALTKSRAGWLSVPTARLTGILAACRNSPHQVPLENVDQEIQAVTKCFEQASAQVFLSSSPNTTSQLLQKVLAEQSVHILHLACHGEQAKNPLDSAFLLSDGRLSIQDLTTIHFPDAVLAFLSACQTAKGSERQPDQAVHLAASMLFCGFRSVIGTMW
jgi:CHAT domain-containing protein